MENTELDFTKLGNGLIPAIIQDNTTNVVLMLGFMNEEAVAKTEEGDFSTDFHLDDYVCHQFDDYVEVGLVLPEGTTVIQMKDGQIPLDVVRDMKIDTILN